MYRQSRPTCNSCEKTFSEQRSLKNHQKYCEKHLEKTGQPRVRYPCDLCGSSFSRLYDIGRHKELGQCPRAPLFPSTQTVTARKHVLSAHYEESPSQRLRTTSPTRSHAEVGYNTVHGVVSCEATVVVSGLEHTDKEVDTLPQHRYDDDMAAGDIVIPDGSNSSSTVGVDIINANTPDDNNFHQVQGGAEVSPSTGSSDSGSATLPAEDTPGVDDGARIQILPITSCEEAVSNVDSVDSITHRLSRTSLEVQESKQKRSSFAFSIRSGYSATSQWTLPSMHSFLTNPSLSHLAKWRTSVRSSNMSHRRASTVPSEMPAPMLEQIDEELINSRGLSGRLERYMPLRKPRAGQQDPHEGQQDPHEHLRVAISTNRVEEVVHILASGRGIIDVNFLDGNGCTPLLEAARHGHESIVTILLEQRGIDVHRRDSRGSTALMWAQRQGHTNIVNQLEAYLSSESGKRGKEDRHVDSDGICCKLLALPAKSLDRAISGSEENQRALWRACEYGDAVKVTRLIEDNKVDINCLNHYNRTPLSIAASHGHHVIVNWLLGYDGVDSALPDADGATALTWAASQGHTQVVQLLLSHEETARRNDAVITASMALAHKNGHKEIVKILMLV
ncbi:hypothetical protein Q7P35_004812 [Cladosporium inversicolor]